MNNILPNRLDKRKKKGGILSAARGHTRWDIKEDQLILSFFLQKAEEV
jgi:hypothetical protein